MFFSGTLLVIRVPTEKGSEILFGREYKREIYISQAADNNSILVR